MASLALHRCFASVRPCTLALCVLPACRAKVVEELPAPASYSAAEQSGATTASAESPPGAPGERPSRQENMGRGFQGKLAMRLQTSEGAPYDLQYLSLGNTARLQIDATEPAPQKNPPPLHVDALIWGESISLMDHQQRTVRTVPLRQIRPRAQPEVQVETKKTNQQSTIQGVVCETYELREGPNRIDACVTGLPGDVDVDKFESVSGIDVPAWAEQLLKQQLLPLRAVVRAADGRELYRLELAEYSPGPVDRALLGVPANYRPVASNSSAAPSPTIPVGSTPGGQP